MKATKILSIVFIIASLSALMLLRHASPLLRLAAASLGMVFAIKVAAVIWQYADQKRFHAKLGALFYFFFWPGVLIDGFENRDAAPPVETGRFFFAAWLNFAGGLTLFLVSSYFGKGESLFWNYAGLLAIFLAFHLGLLEVFADVFRLLGFAPKSLFPAPFRSPSLEVFWGRRWNLAFVDMNKLFIWPTLRKHLSKPMAILVAFAISGLLHELAISFPDPASLGGPFLYFMIQASGVLLEQKRKFARPLVFSWILLPLPLLFTPSFTAQFVGGLEHTLFQFLYNIGPEAFVRDGLITGGILHLLVLCASIQVPRHLNWRKEFESLRRLNQKVVWNYAAYIFSIIVFMSGVSFYFAVHPDSRGAGELIWLIFISLFWWARLLVDHFYFSDSDWPDGALFEIGHVCLGTLFMLLAVLYSSLIALYLNRGACT